MLGWCQGCSVAVRIAVLMAVLHARSQQVADDAQAADHQQCTLTCLMSLLLQVWVLCACSDRLRMWQGW